MIVADDVDDTGIHPALWLWLGVLARAFREQTAQGLYVTSLRRPPSVRVSRHSPDEGGLVTAADFRRWALDDLHAAESWCRSVQFEYGAFLGVVLEPEWLTPLELAQRGGRAVVQPHVHVQLKRMEWPEGL